MKRDYSISSKNKVDFFVGVEVEHTPKHNSWTLFVVGIQPVDIIKEHAQESGCRHIYLGANHSFDGTLLDEWDSMIKQLLDNNFWVTLDFDVQFINEILESAYTEHRHFIPMISVKLPYINQLGYNAVLKLDDTTFKSSNPGVWCHRVHTLMSPETFTDWDEYKNDTILDCLPDPATLSSD